MGTKKVTTKDLADNPVPRLASCLVLDTSYSMNGKWGDAIKPIDELNKGVAMYMKAIAEKEKTREMVEIAIVTFGSKEFSKGVTGDAKNGVKKILDFAHVEDQDAPTFTAYGYTPMGEAVETALDMIEERKQEYKDNVGTYKQPWLVLMTDGYPYDYESSMNELGKYHGDSIKSSSTRTSKLVKDEKLTIIPIALGDEANTDILKKFSPIDKPVKIKNLNFEDFFRFLSESQSDPDKGFIRGDSPDLEEII